MADITYIPIRQLHPHPDNPRKELGDLSELAASIKENGVYQNLTVIPGHYIGKQEYIARYMACAADDGFDLDLNLIGSILGVELSQEFVDSSGKDWYKILDEDGVYGTMPEKVLLAITYSSMDGSYCGYWSKDWNVERQKYVYSYRENPTLDATYEMLTALGYEISDDEQALRDGTHKIFREYGVDTNEERTENDD